MTSPCEVHIYDNDRLKAQASAKKILQLAKKLEQKYNFYHPDSYLSHLNQRKTQTLDPQTKALLLRTQKFYHQTNGVFDVTMGTLTASRQTAPTLEALAQSTHDLTPYLGVEHFTIKKHTLHFDNPYTRIDLGGVVKEFAVDLAVGTLRKARITSALINFGGDIYALGSKPDGSPFKIGIKNPLSPTAYLTHIPLHDQALTTSASYERNHQIEGKIHSHIITTTPLQEAVLSATVMAPTTLESGVLSTALMIEPTLTTPYRTLLIDNTLKIITTP